MGAQIIYSGGAIPADLILTYSWEQTSRVREHELMDNPKPAITLRPASSRTGTHKLYIHAEADAREAARILALAEVFTLTDTARPSANMRFVVAQGGRISVELDPDTRDDWTVAVSFREV